MKTVSNVLVERVAARAACTGADFQADSVAGATACWACHSWSGSSGPGASPVSERDSTPDILTMSCAGVEPERAAVIHRIADRPTTRRSRRRTNPLCSSGEVSSNRCDDGAGATVARRLLRRPDRRPARDEARECALGVDVRTRAKVCALGGIALEIEKPPFARIEHDQLVALVANGPTM